MKTYSVHSTDSEEIGFLELLKRFPNPAEYAPFYLFPMTSEQLTGVVNTNVIDLTTYVLTDDPQKPNEITYTHFDAIADNLLSQEFSSKEVILSREQGVYLRTTRYPDNGE